VHQLALTRGDVAVDGFAHKRMDETERLLRTQNLGVNVLRDRRGQRILGEVEVLGEQGVGGSLAEDRQRSCHGRAIGFETGEPQQHRARRGARTELAQTANVLCRRVDALG